MHVVSRVLNSPPFVLQASMKQKALQTLTGNLQFEKEQKEHHRVSDDASRLINQTSGSGRREPDTTGYVWVSADGLGCELAQLCYVDAAACICSTTDIA